MDVILSKATVVSERGPPQQWEHRKVTSSSSEFTNNSDERVIRVSFSRKTKDEYFSPKHRHNFDQTRYVVDGEVEFGKGLIAKEGDFVYFPASVPYGITVRSETVLVLTLQTHGPEWAFFPTRAQASQGTKELQKISEVDRDNGVVRWPDGRVQDTYEALWEKLMGQSIVYPPARYLMPCLVRSSAFPWRSTSQPGVQIQSLVNFNGVGPGATKVSIDIGSTFSSMLANRHTLIAVISGLLRYGDGQMLKSGALIHCPAGATLEQMTAVETTSLMVVQYSPKSGAAGDPLSF